MDFVEEPELPDDVVPVDFVEEPELPDDVVPVDLVEEPELPDDVVPVDFVELVPVDLVDATSTFGASISRATASKSAVGSSGSLDFSSSEPVSVATA